MKSIRYLFTIFCIIAVAAACKTQTEYFITEPVTDYYPLQVGKFITYRVDSTIFTALGSKTEIHQYQVKHTVTAEGTDNTNRKMYIITKTISNATGTSPWQNNGTYNVTIGNNNIEVIENNMRVVVLQAPLKQGFSWPGNSYLPITPYRNMYDMQAGNDMNKWKFTYTHFGDTTISKQAFNKVWTVTQSYFVNNIPAAPNTYGLKEVSVEKYAKGIGLIYKNYELYEHQPPNADNPSEAHYGFGLTMWLADHN